MRARIDEIRRTLQERIRRAAQQVVNAPLPPPSPAVGRPQPLRRARTPVLPADHPVLQVGQLPRVNRLLLPRRSQPAPIEYNSDDESEAAVAFRKDRRERLRAIATQKMKEAQEAAARAAQRLGFSAPEPDAELLAIIPAVFKCPISKAVMKDPVLLISDGQTYEKVEIERWIRQRQTSPFTSKPADVRDLTPNYTVKSAIDEFKTQMLPKLQKMLLLEKENTELKAKLQALADTKVDPELVSRIKKEGEKLQAALSGFNELVAKATEQQAATAAIVTESQMEIASTAAVTASTSAPTVTVEPVVVVTEPTPVTTQRTEASPPLPPPLVPHPALVPVRRFSAEELQAHLMSAIMSGHVVSIRALLRQVDVNTEVEGMTPLLVAVRFLQIDAVRELLSRGADANKAADVHEERLSGLVQDQADGDITAHHKDTPLILATRLHLQHPITAAQIIRLLTDHGRVNRADVNQKGSLGRTALHWAAANNDERAIDLLLSEQAGKDIIDDSYRNSFCLGVRINGRAMSLTAQAKLTPSQPPLPSLGAATPSRVGLYAYTPQPTPGQHHAPPPSSLARPRVPR